MPSISIQDSFVAVSAADDAGNVTVSAADSVLLYPGTYGWLALDDGSASIRVKLKKINPPVGDNVVIEVGQGEPEYSASALAGNQQSFVSPSYGRLDVSDYNGSAHLCVETQTAPIDYAYSKRIGIA